MVVPFVIGGIVLLVFFLFLAMGLATIFAKLILPIGLLAFLGWIIWKYLIKSGE